MKTIKLLIIVPLVALFIQNANAKSQTDGLYLTLQDYLAHKLSYSGDKIRLDDFLETKNVVLLHNGQQLVLAKSEIFGYRSDGRDYRYFNNAAYRILDSNGIYIYDSYKLVPATKGPKPCELHYFSTDASSPVEPLTKEKLEQFYSKNRKFVYAVESVFKTDDELGSFDPYSKQYKITYLYAQNK